MDIEDSPSALRAVIRTSAARSVSATFEAMLTFYRDERAEGCVIEDDGDMLLFQWGTSMGAKTFEVDLTRQFISEADEDSEIWQLHVTYRLPIDAATKSLGGGDRWCPSPSELDTFATWLRAHPVLAKLGASTSIEPVIELAQV